MGRSKGSKNKNTKEVSEFEVMENASDQQDFNPGKGNKSVLKNEDEQSDLIEYVADKRSEDQDDTWEDSPHISKSAADNDNEDIVEDEAPSNNSQEENPEISVKVKPVSEEVCQSILDLDMNSIKANPSQPRSYFDVGKQKELADSIKRFGQLNPILVYKNPEGENILVAGERRLRACRSLGFATIKALLIDVDTEEAAIIDNIQREDLHPVERAIVVGKLYEKYDRETKRVAQVISTSTRTVERLLKVSSLTDKINATDASDPVETLTNNKIPLREFYNLVRITDNTEFNKKFNDLVKKYSKDPNTNPIKTKVKRDKDDMEKTLKYAQKIKTELENLEFDNSDKRLSDLRCIIQEINQLIKNLMTE